MNALNLNESVTAEAFSKQSVLFDELYRANSIVSYKRERVRAHVSRYLKIQSQILELNSGTGDDAIYFAKEGHTIHATDISLGMQWELKKKIDLAGLTEKISTELCSYTKLNSLKARGPYDTIFSNFAGLNCTPNLQSVLFSFTHLLKPAGTITLVMLPTFCLWEFLLIFKGKFKTAFRRLLYKKGAPAHIEGTHFKCWYYNPSYIINTLKDTFEVVEIEGLCTLVPPSYIEGFAEKHPKTFNFLKNLENKLCHYWFWRNVGDYYIITLKKKS